MNFNNTKPFTISDNGPAAGYLDFLTRLNFFLTTTSNFESILDSTDFKVFKRDGWYFMFQGFLADNYEKVLFLRSKTYTPGENIEEQATGDYYGTLMHLCFNGTVQQYYLFDNTESLFISIEFNPGLFCNMFSGNATTASNKEAIVNVSNKFESYSRDSDILYNFYAIPRQNHRTTFYDGDKFQSTMYNGHDYQHSKIKINDKYYLFNFYESIGNPVNRFLCEVSDLFISYSEGYQNAEEFSINDNKFKAFPNYQKLSPPQTSDAKTGGVHLIIRIE